MEFGSSPWHPDGYAAARRIAIIAQTAVRRRVPKWNMIAMYVWGCEGVLELQSRTDFHGFRDDLYLYLASVIFENKKALCLTNKSPKRCK